MTSCRHGGASPKITSFSVEIEKGEVEISLDFTPSARDKYNLYIRESIGSSRSFLSLTLSDNGTLAANDANGPIFYLPNAYTAGETLSFKLTFDMDARTSSIRLNGQDLSSARAFGISDRGVGKLLIGHASSSNGSSFDLDNIRVTGILPFPPVLLADLEDKSSGAPIVRERNHGIDTRGIGALMNTLTHQTLTSAHMQLDNLRVLASDAAIIPAELEFLTEATSATASEAVSPAITVGVMNALDEAVPDGTPVSLEITPGSGPPGATLDGTEATTVSGVATFSALTFDMPGTYRLAAYSLGATKPGNVDVVVSPGDHIFADGFETTPP